MMNKGLEKGRKATSTSVHAFKFMYLNLKLVTQLQNFQITGKKMEGQFLNVLIESPGDFTKFLIFHKIHCQATVCENSQNTCH